MNALAPQTFKLEAGTGQHQGDRQEQQDRVALFTAPRAPGYVMAVVADGVGELSGGALAAEQVVRTARQSFDLFSPLTDKVETLLESIARDAHTVIKLTAISSKKQPHSTIAILIITPERSAIWAHVGDSRVYRFSGPNCMEQTVDHSMVTELTANSKPDNAGKHSYAQSHMLTSVLGSYVMEPTVSLRRYDGLRAGDAFLLCTDGLWPYLSGAEFGAAVAVQTPRQASEMLIQKARARAGGAGDNCSLAILKLVELPKEARSYNVGKMRRAV